MRVCCNNNIKSIINFKIICNPGHGPELLKLAECRGFCECSLHAFEKGVIGESVLAFSLRLHGLIIENEEVFSIPELQESTKNITLSPRWMVTKNASLQYSFVQMIASLLTHKTGNEWLRSSGAV